MKVDEIRRQRADDYEVRNAKRDRKQLRMRAIVEDDHRSVKKRKSVMSMTSSLTSVTPKSVKRFRYGLVVRCLNAVRCNPIGFNA